MILDTPELNYLPIDQIHPAADNVRSNVGDVKELAATIAAVGILQPLVVTPNRDGYTIVTGHRRHAAAKLANLTTVPCIIRDNMDTAARVEAMAVENLARQDLTILEEAGIYQRLVDAGWTQRKIAERFGCNQSHISKRVKLLDLPDELRDRLDDGRLPVDVGVKLVQLQAADPTGFDQYVKKNPTPSGWSVEEKLNAIQMKKRHEKLAKPYVERGLKLLGRMDWMRWQDCTEAQATAIYVDYQDRVKFVCEKRTAKTTADPAKPRKETAKEKRAREAREAAEAEREAREQAKIAAFRAVVHDDDQPVWSLLAHWMLDIGEIETDELDRLCTVLELPPVGDIASLTWQEQRAAVDTVAGRLKAYLATDEAHAQRLVIAVALTVSAWTGDGAVAEGLRLASTHGYDLTDQEVDLVTRYNEQVVEARARGYAAPIVTETRTCRICGCTDDHACDEGCTWIADDLCSSCEDAVDTVHDPNCPTSTAEIRDAQLAKGRAFAEANDLQPGDEVLDDGTIVRTDA